MLKVNNASYKYTKDVFAVENLSFELKEGEILGLLGANGSGKTTTFRMIMGLIEPTSGDISYYGHKVSLKDTDTIGYMIEERSLLTKLKVKELIYYFASLKNLSSKEIEAGISYWFKRFNIEQYLDKKVSELSKGNQQKIQFIIALINKPKLLILDEPFSGLDVIATDEFIKVLYDFLKNKTMIVFSSHQIDKVEKFCQKVVVLKKGKTIINGDILEIKKNYGKVNILIKADNINIDLLNNIEGVINTRVEKDIVIAKLKDESYKEKVFEYVKTLKNVSKFEVEFATLTEIFIDKVGEMENER